MLIIITEVDMPVFGACNIYWFVFIEIKFEKQYEIVDQLRGLGLPVVIDTYQYCDCAWLVPPV